MSLTHDLRKLSDWTRDHGFSGAVARARSAGLYRFHLSFDRAFDRRWGIETVEQMGRAELGLPPIDYDTNELYGPTPSLLFPALVSVVPKKRRADTTFFDVGAGKAGLMVNARRHGFQRLVGVEYHAAIAEVGRANLTAALGQDDHVSMEVGDGSIHPLPPGDILLMFYNSFRGPTFDTFLKTIDDSLTLDPRALTFVYVNPHCKDQLDAHPRFERLRFNPWAQLQFAVLSAHPILAWRAAR